MKRKAISLCLFIFCSIVTYAQVGIGTTTPDSNSILDVSSSDRGLLMPRVALTATDSPAPLSANVAGMVVYNTATAGSGTNSVTPGFYVNDGSGWVRAIRDVMADSKWVNSPSSVELMYLSDGVTARPAGTEFIALDNGNVGIGVDSPTEALHVNGSFRSISALTADDSSTYYGGFYSGNDVLGSTLSGTAIVSLIGDDILNPETDTFSIVYGVPEQVKIGAFKNGAFGSSTGGYGELNIDYDGVRLWIEDRDSEVQAVLKFNVEDKGLFDMALIDSFSGNSASIKYESDTPIEFSFLNNNVFSSYRFPRTDGANGQILTSDGSGQLSWSKNTDFVVHDNGNVGVGVTNPSEKIVIEGAVKIGDGGYSAISDGATNPTPTGGAGTMVFFDGHFFGWNGTVWKQLDN